MFLLPYKLLPRMAFLVMMGYLAALHIKRMYFDWLGYKLDVTGTPPLVLALSPPFT